MNKSFVIEYPVRLDNMKSPFRRTFDCQKMFYDNLFLVLEEEGIGYRKIRLGKHTDPLIGYNEDEIYLGYHRQDIKLPRFYTIKEGYTLNEMYFDRTGYSGWAELANNEELFEESQNVNLNDAKVFMNNYFSRYKEEDRTKYAQPLNESKLPDKFVLVSLQVANDTVNALADISTYDLARNVLSAYRGTEYSVIIKPHPRDAKFRIHMVGVQHKNNIVRNSINYLIPRASAVYTVNSGVGFESLLYGKPVFSSGHSDYHWVTERVRSYEDILNKKECFDVDRDKVIKFLYYYLSEYVMTYYDKEQIRRKIKRIIGE